MVFYVNVPSDPILLIPACSRQVFCKKLKLIIETDGITHEYDDVFKRDIEKTNYLKTLGYEVLRFQDDEVIDDIDNVKYIIESWIADHPPTPFDLATPKRLRKGERGNMRPLNLIEFLDFSLL